MKRFLSLTLCLAMVAAAGTAFAAKGTVERDITDLRVAAEGADNVITSSTSNAALRYKETAGPDTFALYGGPGSVEGKFQDALGVTPDRQNWAGVDLTDNPVFWQISTFNAENLNNNGAGNNAYWCGRDVGQVAGWASAPGYGNGWNDILLYESDPVADPSVGQTVSLDFFFNHDTEPGYDFFNVEYDSAGTWTSVLAIDGSNKDGSNVFQAPGVQFSTAATGAIIYAGNDYSDDGRIKLRLRVSSDGAWSDEDGLWPTDAGAAQVDDISVTSSLGTFTEDFEGTAPFLFNPDKSPFAGDFSDTYARLDDLDPCRDNNTPVIGFIDYGQDPPNGPGLDGSANTGGSLSGNWDYGIPGSWVTNYTGGLSFGAVALTNEIWSPEIDWDWDGTPGTIDNDPAVSGAFIRFTTWTHLPLANGLFYVWHVRSTQDGTNWTSWEDRNFVYYGGGVPAWGNVVADVTDLLLNNPTQVQMALGVTDLADVFGFPGTDATPSPVFDNAAFYKYRIGGASFATRNIDLANDGFPVNGSIDVSTQASRDALDIPFDMARDINTNDLINTAGDSIIVDVTAVIPGTTVSDIRMKWALRKNPLFEDAIRSAPARAKDENVVAGAAAIWTGEVVADTSTTSAGAVIENRFFTDLPDVDFLYPGDQLHYFIEATDSDGRVTTLPGNTTGFGTWDANGVSEYSRTFTVRGLPSITDTAGSQPTKLVYNDYGRRGGENDFLSMMGQLGFTEGTDYDTYTVQGPTSGVSNGIGSAGAHGATPDQLAGYDTIIHLTGNLSTFLLSNGTAVGNNDKGNDIGTLEGWKALPGQRNTVYFGDYIASGNSADSAEGATYVQTTMGVTLNDADVRDEIDNQTAPKVTGLLPDFDTDFVAFGGCLGINQFDSISPQANAVAGHAFLSPGGAQYADPVASVVYDRQDGAGDRKVDITFPYGLIFVYSDVNSAGTGLSARTELMSDIFTYLGVPASGGNVTSAPQARKADLSIVPNPFNPKTTVKFALPARGEASVKVYNLRGELVRTLHSGVLDAGEHPFVWNGTDNDGRQVSSGVYLVNAVTQGFNATKKAVLVK